MCIVMSLNTILEPSLQLRKINIRHQRELEYILDADDLWKNLMSIIPKTLHPDPTRCNISRHNLPMYNSEDFKIIETVSRKEGRSCTNILFDEWGTFGKVLPTLDHLLYFLNRAELFRAAEYVAKLLGKPSPPRPKAGPAARVSFDSNILKEEDERIRISSKMNAKTSSEIEEEDLQPQLSILLGGNSVNNNIFSSENNCSSNVSNDDNSSLSTSISNVVLESQDDDQLPNLSILRDTIPNITELNQNQVENISLPSCDLPAVSIFNHSTNNGSRPNIPEIEIDPGSSHLPNISFFQNSFNSKGGSSNGSYKCSSPLPNLSLNTTLPHIPWNDLLKATNEFNDAPYVSQEQEGRFLGKGAFGSVYIGFGIREKPVAVKKLMLDAVDDTCMTVVTKQFSNEVEILCKFQHDNLLTLLAFSCDGCTYCLIYEYISGGSLKDRLQNKEHKLIGTDRVYIALGISKAVSYLHTAFKDPVIHRDIKSANILMDDNNKPKLGDFGLVRNIYNKNTSTFTTPIGTSSYMPPEAFRGEISDKVDTYSFGIVLLELLTALPVFDENRSERHLADYVEEQYENGSDKLLDKSAGSWIRNEVNFGEELFQIALKCLEEKKRRPAMTDISRMLSELLEKIN